MKYFSILALILMALVAFVTPSGAVASDATAQLSATMKRIRHDSGQYPVAELRQTGLPDKALKLINSRFDFSEMTKRSLGSHWNALDASEQQEFIDAYTQMVLRFLAGPSGRQGTRRFNTNARFEMEVSRVWKLKW
jgi:ABC-type transporter MlaC component